MNWIVRLSRRIRELLSGSRVERDLSDELRHHIELEAEELLRRGWDPAAARREAFRRFGGEERTKERVREGRPGRWLVDLAQDLRYALRSLRKSPGFTSSALMVLALGIGTSAAGIGVVRRVILRPLPYPQPDELVRVWPTGSEFGDQPLSLPNFRDWSAGSETLASMGLYLVSTSGWTFTVDGQPAQALRTVNVAGDLFGTLDVAPALGRPITEEDIESSSNVVLLSHGAFRRLFGGDPDVVGRRVELDYRTFEVIGVMPPGFAFPEAGVEAWVPVTTNNANAFPYEERGIRWGSAIARLADDRTRADAEAELSRIAAGLEQAFPENNQGLTAARVADLRESIVGDVEVALWSLLGAVGFLLLLSAANVANLLIARGVGRGRELALRRSLGASFGRVVRQLMTESALLAVGGAVLGFGLSVVLIEAVAANATDFIPRTSEMRMDGFVLLAVFAISGLAACVAGVWPAFRLAGNSDQSGELRGAGRALGGGTEGVRLQRWLVAGEVALAVLLLVGSGLLLRSFDSLMRVDPGFEPEGAVAMTVNVPFSGYAEDRGWVTLHEQILARLRELPGVESTGAIGYLPFRGEGEGWLLDEPEAGRGEMVRIFPSTTDAFQALGVPLLSGRTFRVSDGPDDVPVAVVNETMAREWFGGEDPIGRRIVSGSTEWEVVGVVGDVRQAGLEGEVVPSFYSHVAQSPRSRQSYVVRTGGDPTDCWERCAPWSRRSIPACPSPRCSRCPLSWPRIAPAPGYWRR